MKGYPSIGSLYLLPNKECNKTLLWAVIENNSNNNQSTLSVIEQCPEKGTKARVDTKWILEREAIGPILPPSGDVVIEEGREFIKRVSSKGHVRSLKLNNSQK